MAIEFARVEYVKRSDGGNACRTAAYNGRSDVRCERTGERFYFTHRDGLLHSEVLLPDGSDEKFLDIETLWNDAQRAEKRKDAQEARELLLALPSNNGLIIADWRKLTASFADEYFVDKGVAVQIGIHEPHDGDKNFHAHLLITTRRIEGERFSAAKARDLDPEVRTMRSGRHAVTEGERWGALWRDHQNRYFEANGLDIRVDETGIVPQSHEGPIRQRATPDSARVRAEDNAAANAEAMRDPEQLIARLTHHQATFTVLDIERLLRKHVPNEIERTVLRTSILTHADIIALHERDNGEFSGRYTSRRVRESETSVLMAADVVATNRFAVDDRHRREVAGKRGFDREQEAAFLKATGTDGLVIIEGMAGAGKSYSVDGIRDAHERAGWRVIGLAHTNTVAEDLRRNGFRHGSTLALELFYQQKNIKERSAPWNRSTCVIVDEAAMLDTAACGKLLRHAADTGAKVILVGDDRQLSSIEHGGMFTELKQRHGSAVISKVRRQEADWQRVASEDFATGNISKGLRAYAEAGCIHWSGDLDESRARLLSDWDQDSRMRPQTHRFVYASTNAAVDRLNQEIRDIRRRRGEVRDELNSQTARGLISVGTGDRVQFFASDRRAGIYSGTIGTVTGVDGARLFATTDTGRDITWDSTAFDQFGLGYAGTVYRGQGKTQTEVYALYDSAFAWNARTTYVGLTRHRTSVNLYVSRELAQDERQLANQLSRRSHDESSLVYATAAEIVDLAAARARKEEGGASAGVGEGGQLPREQAASFKRIDLAQYAREVHGFTIQRDVRKTNQFVISNAGAGRERLLIRRDHTGSWSYINPNNPQDRGDILDFAKRQGAPSLKKARAEVSVYQTARGPSMRQPELARKRSQAIPQAEIPDSDPNAAEKRRAADAEREAAASAEAADRQADAAQQEKLRTEQRKKEEAKRDAAGAEEAARKAKFNAEMQEAAELEQKQLLDMQRHRPANHEAFVADQTARAEKARRATGIGAPDSNRGQPDQESFPASASLRYAESLARHYDPGNPYGTLARAALAESTSFQRERWELDRKIALEANPERREMLLLRRDIEHADYLGLTWDRISGQTRAVTLNANHPDAKKQEQVASGHRQTARESRKAWEERAFHNPGLYAPLSEQMRDRIVKRQEEAKNKSREPDGSELQRARREHLTEKFKDIGPRPRSRAPQGRDMD